VRRENNFTHCLSRNYLEVGGRPHDPADLPTEQVNVRGPQLVWALRQREKYLVPAEIRTRGRPAHALVTNYNYAIPDHIRESKDDKFSRYF